MTRTEERAREKEKRAQEIFIILKTYVQLYNESNSHQLRFSDDAHLSVCNVYFDLLDSTIKEYLVRNTRANKFKIASGTEIAIMKVLPIEISGNHTYEERRRMNALFASFFAYKILTALTPSASAIISPGANEELHHLWVLHIKWLTSIQRDSIENSPTFCNSLFWEAFMIAYVHLVTP